MLETLRLGPGTSKTAQFTIARSNTATAMKTRLICAATAMLTMACAAPRPVPPDVAIMPNDCANKPAIDRWIESQSAVPRQPFQSEADYDRQRSQIRHRLWTLRYNCQPR